MRYHWWQRVGIMILPITYAWHLHAFLPSESVTGLSSDPLHNCLAFLAPRWPLDADECFVVPGAPDNSAADGLRPSWLVNSVSGERETSRTLPADRRIDKATFWALWVGTRTTLPKYDVWQRCKIKQNIHAAQKQRAVYWEFSNYTVPQKTITPY